MRRPEEPFIPEDIDEVSVDETFSLLVESAGRDLAVVVHVFLTAGETLEIRLRMEELRQG